MTARNMEPCLSAFSLGGGRVGNGRERGGGAQFAVIVPVRPRKECLGSALAHIFLQTSFTGINTSALKTNERPGCAQAKLS